MGRRCNVCANPERAAIDAALVAGERADAISLRFGIHKQSLWRHRDAHLPKATLEAGQQAIAEAEGKRGLTLLEQAH
ncbi:MAG TPA: hypothetical protein VIE65_03775, partial [Methylobacter sp.]